MTPQMEVLKSLADHCARLRQLEEDPIAPGDLVHAARRERNAMIRRAWKDGYGLRELSAATGFTSAVLARLLAPAARKGGF